MELVWKKIIWRQFGAAIDMLENAIKECPANVWGKGDPSKGDHAFWYMVYHTLFFLDYYLSEDPDTYRPPAPYTLSELDEAGAFPDRIYTKDELLAFLEHSRRKCREVVGALTDGQLTLVTTFRHWNGITVVELHLYNMRHVQHHTAQLNLLLRQQVDSAPRWVSVAKADLEEA